MHPSNGKSKYFSSEPSVIPVFFATEMWERFGFYMIQALLILYMTSAVFDFSDSQSYAILGAFSAIAYTTPIIGGYFASKVLDYEHAVIFGGFLLVVGYALLSLPHENFFYIALAIIATGTGFFKPSLSSYLGDFYRKDDSRREKGYTILYMGINFGILLSTSTSGFLVRYFGWHIPYLIASMALLFGLVTFVFGMYYLKDVNNFNRIEPSVAKKNPLTVMLVYLSAVLLVVISYEMIHHRAIADHVMLWGSIAALSALITRSFNFSKEIRNKLIICIFLIVVSIAFWALFFQVFFSMNLFIQRVVDRKIFDVVLPTPFFLSLEPIFIMLLGPYLALRWGKLSKENKNPRFTAKFVCALLSLAIAFAIMYASTRNISTAGTTNMLFIVFAYFFITLGELLLSPVGMAMITILVPQELVGLMMGVWFVALGLGEKLASVIANYAAIPRTIHSIAAMNAIYGNSFFQSMLLSLGCAVVCGVFSFFLNKILRQ